MEKFTQMFRRPVYFGEVPEGAKTEKPVSIEEEMKKETLGERQVALLLKSNDVAGKENPAIKKYLEGVQAKLNGVLAKKGPAGVRSIPKVDDITPGQMPQDIEGRVVRGTEMSRAYRRVYAELMTLAVNGLSQRQKASFEAHKDSVSQVHAKSMMDKYNQGKKPDKQLKLTDMPRIAGFINAAMGVNFNGNDKSFLTPAERAKKFADALKTVSIDRYATLTVDERTLKSVTEKEKANPRINRYAEIMKNPSYEATINGLMERAKIHFVDDKNMTIDNVRDYSEYLIDRMNSSDYKANMPLTDFRSLFATPEQFGNDQRLVVEYKKKREIIDQTAAMKPKEKVEMTAKFFNDAVEKAKNHIKLKQEDLKENQYLQILNNIIANEWNAGLWNSRGLDSNTLNAGAKAAGLTVLTYTSEGKPPQVPVPEGEPPYASADAQALMARLTPREKQQEGPRKRVMETVRVAIKGFMDDLDRIEPKDRPVVLEARIKNALANSGIESVDDFMFEDTGIQINYRGASNIVLFNCKNYVADIERKSTERVAAVIRNAVSTVKKMGIKSANSILNRLNIALAQQEVPDEDKKVLSKTDPIKGSSTKLLAGHKFVITYDTNTSSFSATEESKTT